MSFNTKNMIIEEKIRESGNKYYAYIDYVLFGSTRVQTKSSDWVETKQEAEIELLKLKQWFYELKEAKRNQFWKEAIIWGLIIVAILVLGI